MWHCLFLRLPGVVHGECLPKDALSKAKKSWGQSSPSLSKHSQPGKAWTAPFPGIEGTFEVDSKSKCCEQKSFYFPNPSKFTLFEQMWRIHDTSWYYIWLHCMRLQFFFETRCLFIFIVKKWLFCFFKFDPRNQGCGGPAWMDVSPRLWWREGFRRGTFECPV